MLELSKGILAIDVGSGTQDILVWRPDRSMENCPKLILPSPTTILSRRIKDATKKGQHVFLAGTTMGGGASTRAVRKHLAAGLKVFAVEKAALTFHDRIEKVAAMGIEIVDEPPKISPLVRLEMGDLDLHAIGSALALFHEPLPDTVAVAVQDHGFSPKMSNRIFRFEQWKKLLKSGKDMTAMLYESPPEHLSRMNALTEVAPGTLTMDTGGSAILGALEDPWVAEKSLEGTVILNIGNEHVLAALVKNERVWGIYEHHTSLMDPDKLKSHLKRFRRGEISNQEILDEMGHGCHVLPEAPRQSSFPHLAMTGPNRGKYARLGAHMAAPFGDMMLTGCFGLVKAVRAIADR